MPLKRAGEDTSHLNRQPNMTTQDKGAAFQGRGEGLKSMFGMQQSELSFYPTQLFSDPFPLHSRNVSLQSPRQSPQKESG